jgi:hypothetical protein
MKLSLFSLLVCCFFLSCNKEKIGESETTMNDIGLSFDSLQSGVLRGDVKSYINLKTVMLDYPSECLIFWSMVMAHKYDYPEAYLDLYITFTTVYRERGLSFEDLDTKTKNLLTSYLQEASKGGVSYADTILVKLNVE